MVIGIFGDSILGPDGAKTQRIENQKKCQGSKETYSRNLLYLEEPVSMAVTELQPWHTNVEERGIIGTPNNAIISERQIDVYCY
jgi:hypothetical protein